MRTALRKLLDIIVQLLFVAIQLGDLRALAARYNQRLDPMSLLQASNLTKSYGAQDVLDGVSVTVPHQARLALVGSNGVGKSTLLRILADLESPDGGRVRRAKNLSLGYLPQEATASSLGSEELSRSLWQVSLEAFADLRQMEDDLTQLEAEMADPRTAADAIDRYGHLQETFERAGGYSYRADTERVLRGLGFDEERFDRPLSSLSGGERTRALLGRLLLEDPDLLVLDEPTNHLDFEAIEWLEGWLDGWPGAALIVSHDRYFLDQTVTGIWELTERGLETFRGNYSDYVQQRGARDQRRSKVAASQREHIEREREFIRRNLAGQNTRQAQGRRKRLERFLSEETTAETAKPRRVHIAFEGPQRSGEIALTTEDLVVGRGGEVLFEVPDLLLRRGERAAILGPNGAGKSTFLKTLLGDVEPVRGRSELGAKVTVGYFAQAHEKLRARTSVLESLLEVDEALTESTARDLLAQFQLRGDAVEKRVMDLSGGERGRLALARLTRQGANLLLLDEPTNHLDIPSQEVLQGSLERFEGTILLVSHDRYLIDALATQVWAVHPEARTLEVVGGAYEEYQRARRHRKSEGGPQRREERPTPEKGAVTGANKNRTLLRMERLEDRIQELEEGLAKVSAEIAEVRHQPESLRALGERYAALERQLDDELAEWEELARRVEGP